MNVKLLGFNNLSYNLEYKKELIIQLLLRREK
jgi:hypothetical protein